MTTIYTSKKREFSEGINERYTIEELSKIKELKNYSFTYYFESNGILKINAYKNDAINPKEFQIIPITSEMKSKYPALKKYKEILFAGKEMNWYDAMDYAKKNRAVLPDRKEGKAIAKIIIDSGYEGGCYFWTREIDYDNYSYIMNLNGRAWSELGQKFGLENDKNYKRVICLR